MKYICACKKETCAYKDKDGTCTIPEKVLIEEDGCIYREKEG